MTHIDDNDYGEGGYGLGGYGGVTIAVDNRDTYLETFSHPLVDLSPQSTARKFSTAVLYVLDQMDRDLLAILDAHHLRTATGVELDRLGRLVEANRREGERDRYFRQRIRAEGGLKRMQPTFENLAPYVTFTLIESDYSTVSFVSDLDANPATFEVSAPSTAWGSATLDRSDIDDYAERALPAGHAFKRTET